MHYGRYITRRRVAPRVPSLAVRRSPLPTDVANRIPGGWSKFTTEPFLEGTTLQNVCKRKTGGTITVELPSDVDVKEPAGWLLRERHHLRRAVAAPAVSGRRYAAAFARR